MSAWLTAFRISYDLVLDGGIGGKAARCVAGYPARRALERLSQINERRIGRPHFPFIGACAAVVLQERRPEAWTRAQSTPDGTYSK